MWYIVFFLFFFNFLLEFRFWGTWAEHVRQLRRNTHGSVLFFPSPLHPHLAFLPRLSLPTSPSLWPSPFLLNRPQCLVLPFLCPCVLIFHHPPMSEDMRCFIFCSCVSLLRMTFSRFIHVPTNDTNSSFLIAASYSMVYMCYIFPIQSIINGHLGWFQVFAIVNSAAMNIRVHVSL